MKKFYAILCIAIASLTQLQAQVPQGFNYQATVRNSNGDLVMNQNVYFKFNILQGSQTAVPSYVEAHYVPTDDLGQITLVIGKGSPTTGDFSELNWSLGSYYLDIEIDTGNGYVAMGTTQFFSVPYALYSKSSGSSGSSNLPEGTNDGDSLVWDSSTNSWVVNGSEFCQIDLSTTNATNITTTSFTLNGVISNSAQNCEPPNNTQQGFVYSYSVQPTVNTNVVYVDGTEISTTIVNALNKTHYYRTFITTVSGTFYGNTISFTPSGFDGSVTDIDGNTHDYITYGNQDWTVENAELETYRDGTPIPQITDDNEWENTNIGAWSYVNNDPSQGKVYNWLAVHGVHDNDNSTPLKQFAPEGWHVPTVSEWYTLKEHLIENGYNYNGVIYDCPCEESENKIAKSVASTTGWNESSISGVPGNDQTSNNYSGFNAKPLGWRYSSGIYYGLGSGANFWPFNSSSSYPISVEGSIDGLNLATYDSSSVTGAFNNGYSVRFVKD